MIRFDMDLREAIEFAKARNHYSAIDVKETLDGKKLYRAIPCRDWETAKCGYPQYIVEETTGLRMTTMDEKFRIMGISPEQTV